MGDWLWQQYKDISGNLKWALLGFLWWLVDKYGKTMLQLIPHVPAWAVNAAILVASIAMFLWVAKWHVHPQPQLPAPPVNTPPQLSGESDWRKLYLEANEARTEYQNKYAEAANERNRLKDELEQSQKAQKPLSQHPIPDLRLKIWQTCRDLEVFLASHGDKVKLQQVPAETPEEYQARMNTLNAPELKAARIKYAADYRRRYHQIVIDLRDEIGQRCGISDAVLNDAIEWASNGAGAANALEKVIERFYDVARNVSI